MVGSQPLKADGSGYESLSGKVLSLPENSISLPTCGYNIYLVNCCKFKGTQEKFPTAGSY